MRVPPVSLDIIALATRVSALYHQSEQLVMGGKGANWRRNERDH